MITMKLELGKFYKFQYESEHNGQVETKPRLAVLLEKHANGQFLAWDFSIQGYRNFNPDYMFGLQDVSTLCVSTEKTNRTFPHNVRTKIHNGVLYAVKIR